MTKITSDNINLIYHLVKLNNPIILASSDRMIVFKDNIDVTQIQEIHPEVQVEENFIWKK